MLTSPSLSYDLVHRAGSRRAAVAVEVVRDGEPVFFGRVQAVPADADHLEADHGKVVEVRTDAYGRALLDQLAPGRWSLLARDSRRTMASEATLVEVADTGVVGATLSLDAPTSGELVVDVRGADALPAEATTITVIHADGHRVVAPLLHGLAHVRGLRPGAHTVVVPPALGQLGTALPDVRVEAGALISCTVTVPVGGVVSGRVVQGGVIQYSAVVRLLDAVGTELERTRTDADGRFVLGVGLPSSRGLTVEATSGPQTLHVTSAALADVVVLADTHRDLGDVHLPVAGNSAVWASRTRAVAGMKLPSTRL